MRRIADINILEDEGLQRRVVWWSVAILVGGLLAGLFALVAGLVQPERVGIWWVVALVGASAVALPVHELVHAFFFKALSHGECAISFG
ncbi:MAG: hypothetical protein IJ781_05220, partial [Atopobiaceae bacterium]|nr:hypothetical protein [Atopobiaceae bacterium]